MECPAGNLSTCKYSCKESLFFEGDSEGDSPEARRLADVSCHSPSLDAERTVGVTIWKLGRTVCVYSMVQRREKEKDSRYMNETSAPAAVTVYQICNISPAQVYL